jgi:hypothetical protein
MRRIGFAISSAFIFLISNVPPVLAQMSKIINPQVEIEYIEPAASFLSRSEFDSIYQWLRIRRPLDEMQQFLAPLHLPGKLKIQVDKCGADRRAYVPGGPVTICYELISKIEKIADQFSKNDPAFRQIVVSGTFVQVALHEVAYAIFDILQVPIWGREDDAADKLAAFILLQFGEDVAQSTITGTINFFKWSLAADPKKTWTGSAFADTASPEPQRFYNYLCMAYGADPITFDWVVEPTKTGDPLLPWDRAGIIIIHNADKLDPKTNAPMPTYVPIYSCQHEYEQVRNAFNLRIMPYVDPDLLLKVKAQQWFLPGDLTK